MNVLHQVLHKGMAFNFCSVIRFILQAVYAEKEFQIDPAKNRTEYIEGYQ
jgi:hypothetical protein